MAVGTLRIEATATVALVPAGREAMIGVLRRALDQVERGDLRGVVVLGIERDGVPECHHAGCGPGDLAAAALTVQALALDRMGLR